MAAVAAGFAIDASSFESNLLAELAGAVVGIGIAILVVERILDEDRRARWNLVETQTIETLRFALVKATLPIYLHLPAPRPPEADPLSMEEAGNLEEGMRELAGALRGHRSMDLEPTPLRKMLETIAAQIEFIRDNAMQRLLTVGADPELVKRLAMLEAVYERLDYDAWLEEKLGSRIDETTHRLADLVDSVRQVVTHLDSG
ncbi:MAG TPA: hypothetical protein VFS64_02455 [Solirubrobacterales bacterium]|nr:hypothetical protein [Solirubrobacterales bacterium]